MKRHALSLAAVTVLALATVPAAYSGGAETVYMENPKTLSADAMYVGGAIIIGLAASGFIACAGFAAGKTDLNPLAGAAVYMMVTGAVIVTVAQGIAMLHAGGVSLATPYEFTNATIGGALGIIVGFALMTAGRLAGPKRQPAQAGKTD